MRHITEKGLDLIKVFENFQALPYFCPAKVWTIGYGHVILPTDSFDPPISVLEAEMVLMNDVRGAELSVGRLIKVPLFGSQFDALVSFTFNIGGGALQRSTLRMRVNRGERDLHNEFLRWCRIGGRFSRGLFNRRVIESNFYHLGI